MTKTSKFSFTLLFAGIVLALTACSSAPVGKGKSASRSKAVSSAKAKTKVPDSYRVRVGLYSTKGRNVARKVEKQLDKAGNDAYIQRSGKYYALYVGRDLSKSRAAALKRRIDAFLKVKTLVVAE